jgi:signal transduction histidine kinase
MSARDTREPPGEGDKHRALVDGVPNGILALFDADLTLRVVGPKTLPVSGDDAATKQGRTIDELYPAAVLDRLTPAFEATLDGEPQRLDVVHLGRVHRVETAPTTVDGKQHGVVLTQDVTDERRAHEELERQRRQLEAFASVVSHDLRNPLAIARGYLDVVTGDVEAVEHVSALARVDRALVRMEEIITELLGATEPREVWRPKDTVDLGTVVAAAWEMVETGDATLDNRVTLTVDGDRSRLTRLFENLFRNAVEHAGSDTAVVVDDHPGGFVVADDGPGIDPKQHDVVFQAGYSTQTRGTGFGLFIVRDIALAHGWEVRVGESEGGLRLEFT